MWPPELLALALVGHTFGIAGSDRVDVLGICPTDLEYYPWVPWRQTLRGHLRIGAAVEHSLLKGCRGHNRTLLPGRFVSTYDQLRDAIGLGGFRTFMDSGDFGLVVRSLLAKHEAHNRHLLACPFAVLAGLRLWYVKLVTIGVTHQSDETVWDAASREQNFVKSVLRELTEVLVLCQGCSSGFVDQFPTALQRSGWQASEWFHNTIQQAQKQFFVPKSEGPEFASEKLTDRDHWELLRDSHELLEQLRGGGLCLFWVVTHGTMLAALRYGHSRGVFLPSGNRFFNDTYDMDVTVFMQDSSQSSTRAFLDALEVSAKRFGFSWCGWQTGWSQSSMACWRKQGELDIFIVGATRGTEPIHISTAPEPHPLLLSAKDPVHCRSAPSPTGTAVDDGGEGDDVIQLPCPRDPRTFMRYLWRYNPAASTCLALGDKRDGAKLAVEDVHFLWDRANQLHSKGFANLAQYFGECEGHPLAEVAQALYWNGWHGMRPNGTVGPGL